MCEMGLFECCVVECRDFCGVDALLWYITAEMSIYMCILYWDQHLVHVQHKLTITSYFGVFK